MSHPTLLIVAKAPVAGLAKTRIAQTIGDEAAAELAAAALLDTLDAAAAVGWPLVVAMTGDLTQAARFGEITEALREPTLIEQRGDGLGQRIAHAHADADGGRGVVQVGMDTPQVTVEDFLDAGRLVDAGHRTIGLADDGGWWLLGLPDGADAAALADVPMSQADTGALTEAALGDVAHIAVRRDMDTWDDAQAIAAELPISRVAAVVGALS
ncbi:DUF2064 domain-containing protein [Aeromicrobium panaciterrae]|uniref:TIGR04282 family arsenosugar biosynthesis glycosyltransferase n=1 Tax=Aeromicrobium panaciterrae TaxID=363861 RepID=UPI0031D81F5A